MEKTTSCHKVTSSKSFVLILVLVLVLVVFCLINPNYLGWQNIKNILYATSLSGTLAVGIGCMLISGSPDLSAGAVGMAGIFLVLSWMLTQAAGGAKGSAALPRFKA